MNHQINTFYQQPEIKVVSQSFLMAMIKKLAGNKHRSPVTIPPTMAMNRVHTSRASWKPACSPADRPSPHSTPSDNSVSVRLQSVELFTDSGALAGNTTYRLERDKVTHYYLS